MSHSSIMPLDIQGRRMYVYCAIGGMAAVSADAADRGRVLWKTTEWNHAVVAPSPVFLPDGRIFVTAGYGVGSRMFRVRLSGGSWSVEPVASWSRKEFACEQQTPLLYGGHLFTVLPNDAGPLNRQMVCMHPDGTRTWNSGKTERYGLGPYLAVDGKLLVLSDDGFLTMLRARTDRFERLARARVLYGRDAWAPMAVVAGRLLCRDSKRMVCLDLRAGAGGS
jgi:outer membrane protein assembly factor BamB